MKNKKRVLVILVAMLLAFVGATIVNAGAATGYVIEEIDPFDVFGEVYINVKTNSIYAETSAYSGGFLGSDYVAVQIVGYPQVKNTGTNYTYAWDQQYGSFSGTQRAYGYITRNGIFAYGSTSATP